jgi:hypothetical protein
MMSQKIEPYLRDFLWRHHVVLRKRYQLFLIGYNLLVSPILLTLQMERCYATWNHSSS